MKSWLLCEKASLAWLFGEGTLHGAGEVAKMKKLLSLETAVDVPTPCSVPPTVSQGCERHAGIGGCCLPADGRMKAWEPAPAAAPG